jgi:hypothetical protein
LSELWRVQLRGLRNPPGFFPKSLAVSILASHNAAPAACRNTQGTRGLLRRAATPQLAPFLLPVGESDNYMALLSPPVAKRYHLLRSSAESFFQPRATVLIGASLNRGCCCYSQLWLMDLSADWN